MAENNSNKPTTVGKIFRIIGLTFAGISLFAAGVAASDTNLGRTVDGIVKKGAKKIGLSKAKDESSSRSDEERDKDRDRQ